MADVVTLLARGVRDSLIGETQALALVTAAADLPLDPAEALANLTPADWAEAAIALAAFKATGEVPWS